MTMRAKRPTTIALFLLFSSMAALAVAFVDDGQGKVYNAFEKAFYMVPAEGAWIYPGLNLAIQNVAIPATASRS